VTDSPYSNRRNGSPTCPIVDPLHILFAVADGKLSVRAVRVLVARYSTPGAGCKTISRKTGIPVSTVRRAIRRMRRIFSSP
jgi:DNA-binding MarR family transcriptional regulator